MSEAAPVVRRPFRPEPLSDYRPPHPPYLSIVQMDEEVIVIDKPSGLLAVPGKESGLADCVEARAAAAFPVALIVHRLDMDTSGLMLLARSKRAQRILNGQFARRIIEKTYMAEVWGAPQASSGVVSLPLKADWPNRPRQMVDETAGKPAVTRWEVAARRGATTLLRLAPETGRSHQLRVHMAAIGHPIIGDPFYAAGPARAASARLALYATGLRWRRPQDGAWSEVSLAADAT